MREIIIGKNEEGQRIDRFIKKYLPEASKGFIYKMIRKKNIKLNGKRAVISDIIKLYDRINIYLSEDTINTMRGDNTLTNEIPEKEIELEVVYEDKNIIIINKPKGMLSHSNENNDNNNVVDQFLSYLYHKNEYNPNKEKTFKPAICNRIDRNTTGILIGAKNYETLKEVNRSFRERTVERYYKCIVFGEIKEKIKIEGFLTKTANNTVKISNISDEDNYSKKIETDIKSLKIVKDYTLLEVELVTGRTHQIRAQLSSIKHPIIGDTKYGNKAVNKIMFDKYQIKSQYLHGYKVIFRKLKGDLEYLNNKVFISEESKDMKTIEEDIFR